MAIARSYARRNAETNRGIKTGTIAFTRWITPPLSKSAPRAFWALMILSVSSSRVGTNRSAMVIIMAISCTGTFSFFSGRSSRSSASVNWVGLVVKVRMALHTIRVLMRTATKTARRIPSTVIRIKPHCSTGSPEP